MPAGMRIAGAWSWRLLAIAGVIAVLLFLIVQLRLIVIPIMVAMLLAALLVPFSNLLQRHRWPKWLAVAVSEVGILAILGGLIWLTVVTVRRRRPGARRAQRRPLGRPEGLAAGLAVRALRGRHQHLGRDFLSRSRTTPAPLWSGALSVGSTVGHVLAGFLLVLFATLFILIDGRGIWHWIVRLFPRRSRAAVLGGGRSRLDHPVDLRAGADARRLHRRRRHRTRCLHPRAVLRRLPARHPDRDRWCSSARSSRSSVPCHPGALAVFVALVFLGPCPAFIMLGIVHRSCSSSRATCCSRSSWATRSRCTRSPSCSRSPPAASSPASRAPCSRCRSWRRSTS